MEEFVFLNVFIFVIVGFICVLRGLDLRKWTSWLIGLYGFLSGLLFGFLVGWNSSVLILAFLFAATVISGGALSRLRRQY